MGLILTGLSKYNRGSEPFTNIKNWYFNISIPILEADFQDWSLWLTFPKCFYGNRSCLANLWRVYKSGSLLIIVISLYFGTLSQHPSGSQHLASWGDFLIEMGWVLNSSCWGAGNCKSHPSQDEGEIGAKWSLFQKAGCLQEQQPAS